MNVAVHLDKGVDPEFIMQRVHGGPIESLPLSEGESAPTPQQSKREVPTLLQIVLDLVSLTKPRVISLLLISTCCPMILAAGGVVYLDLILWALLGGALVSGSASAFNCILEGDIDRKMERTMNRPMAQDRLPVSVAYLYSVVIGFLGLYILATYLNPVAAAIALGGHLFYVVIYTLWLKRRTPQNIVIGGAAGAVPPLVGWAAITGSIDMTAFLLFLVVFLWTPPHFWALALNKNKDYQRAGVPMLPVIAGEKETYAQMLLYALLLIPASIALVLSSADLGWFSLSILCILSVVFSYKVYELQHIDPANSYAKAKKGWDVFGFSLVYLALLFVCIVIDSMVF